MINKIFYSGILLTPLTAIIGCTVIYWCTGEMPTFSLVVGSGLLGGTLSFMCYINNARHRRNGKERFGLFDGLLTMPTQYDQSIRTSYLRPPVTGKYLNRDARGQWVCGRANGKYVVIPESMAFHCLVQGGTGSGKSASLFITNLLNLFYYSPLPYSVSCFVLDVKPELYRKTVFPVGHPKRPAKVITFDILDRTSYGFDPLYGIDSSTSEQEIYMRAALIAEALIPLDAGGDKYFIIAPRSMLTGFICYYISQGECDLCSIIDAILGKPIQEHIDGVISSIQPQCNAYRCLIQFFKMEMETLGSVYSSLCQFLMIFSTNEDVRWHLRDNSQKFDPRMLIDGYSIFVCIPESQLSRLSNLLRLMVMLVFNCLSMRELSQQDMGTATRIYLFLDEYARICAGASEGGGGGSLGVEEMLMLGRSRGVSVICALQSSKSMTGLVGLKEDQWLSMIENFTVKCYLTAQNETDVRLITESAGKFMDRRKSYNSDGRRKSTNVSYSNEDLLTPKDLRDLSETGEYVLITQDSFAIVKKAFYFKDKKFAGIAGEIEKAWGNNTAEKR